MEKLSWREVGDRGMSLNTGALQEEMRRDALLVVKAWIPTSRDLREAAEEEARVELLLRCELRAHRRR